MVSIDADAVEHAGDLAVVRSVFELLPVFVVALEGPDHRLVAANHGYRSMLGRDDWRGRPAREVFPDIAGQRLFELLDQVYASGDGMDAREWRIQFQRADDTEPTEWYFDFTLTPWLSPDGHVRGIVVSQTDVTDRVRARLRQERRAADAEERYETARAVVAQVQEALLPGGLPVLPRAGVAAAYLVAGREQAAGGDWFDAVVLPGGRIAVVVGDVVGHGVLAAAAMAEARSVLNELLTETADVDLALRRVDRLARRRPGLRAATLCVAVLDTSSGDVRYSTCGHPPPVVVTRDGTVRFLPATGSGPLGTTPPPLVAEESVAPGDVLMLYSDGLVERPGRTLAAGLGVLAQVVGDAAANRVMPLDAPPSRADRACLQTVEIMTREGYDDDVTALAVELRPSPVPPLNLTLPAITASAREARDAVRSWLAPLGVTDDDADVLELAVSELAANAIGHAYPAGRPGQFTVTAELDDHGLACIRVSDHGTWQNQGPPSDAAGGRGLWITGQIVDELHVEPRTAPSTRRRANTAAGTVATIRHRLTHRASLATPHRPAPGKHRRHYADHVDDGPPRTLRVSGAIDIDTAPVFAHSLDVSSRGGLHPMVVDLTAVDLLGSAGIQALIDARNRHEHHGYRLVIRTSPGSVAAQVCDLSGLEHESR